MQAKNTTDMVSVDAGYRALQRIVQRQPLISQGTVNIIKPKSPNGKTLYTWTRKVRAKTVTVSLSKKQAAAFRKAIDTNRRIENILAQLRKTSQAMLTSESPVSKKITV